VGVGISSDGTVGEGVVEGGVVVAVVGTGKTLELNHIRVLTTQLYTSIKLQQKVYRE
jgi:ATP phosphoribosyltransferase